MSRSDRDHSRPDCTGLLRRPAELIANGSGDAEQPSFLGGEPHDLQPSGRPSADSCGSDAAGIPSIEAAESVLLGERPVDAVFRAAAAAAAAAIDPLEEPQTDARYRRELVEAMVHRALKQACA